MARQSFVWTCLPNGLDADGGHVRLSVLLSPRLDPEGDAPALKTFPEWLDWPAALVGQSSPSSPTVSRWPGARSAQPATTRRRTRRTARSGRPSSARGCRFGPTGSRARSSRARSIPIARPRCTTWSAASTSTLPSGAATAAADWGRPARQSTLARPGGGRGRGGPLGNARDARNLPRGEGATQAERRFATLRTLARMATHVPVRGRGGNGGPPRSVRALPHAAPAPEADEPVAQ